jgi:hypothetical protein
MSKLLLVLMASLAITAYAEDAEKMFDTTRNMTNKSNINWIQVVDPAAACEYVSKKKGYGGFPNPVLACAFWDWDKTRKEAVCTVYTGAETSMHILGHEMRHCFQGTFHKAGENEQD